MTTLAIEQADESLAAVIEKLPPDEDVLLTRAGKPVATIRAAPREALSQRRLGTLRGSVIAVASDFDAIPEGFEDYHP